MSSADGPQAAARVVFVDDTDSNIQYNGFDWHLQTYTTENDTSFSSLPLYGTLHFTQPLGSDTNITYSYQGTSMTAKFMSTDLTKVTCTIDGQPQQVSSMDTLGGAQCTTNGTIQDGTHELVIGLDGSGSISQPLSLFFDGLTYVPSDGATNIEDVFITSGPSLNLGPSSTTTEWHWDFEFIGYSMSLYINYNSELSVVQTNGSYTLDGQGPYNFTTANPLFASTAPQLLVQTPRYQLGQHKFHLDYTHNGETIPFSFYGITVQNTTSTVDQGLEVIPAIPSSSTLSPSSLSTGAPMITNQAQPQHLPNHIPAIVGSIIAVIAVLSVLFTTWFILRRRRVRAQMLGSNEEDIDDINPIIEPFHRRSILDLSRHEKPAPANQEQPIPFILNPISTGNHSSTKVNVPIPPPPPSQVRLVLHEDTTPFILNPTSTGNPSSTKVNVPVPSPPPSQVRVVIHEDSGAEVAQPDVETEVVDLPPNYASLWRRVTGARGPDNPTLSTPSGDRGSAAVNSNTNSDRNPTEQREKGRARGGQQP